MLTWFSLQSPTFADAVLTSHWSDRFVEHLFIGPMWPATLLAMFVWAFVLISLLGFFTPDFGFGGPDVDVETEIDLDPGIDVDAGLDGDVSVDPSHDVHSDFLGGFAAATLKAVHLDRVPLMIWLAVFSLLFWVVTYVMWFEFDSRRYAAMWLPSVLLTIRNGVIAVVLTRLLTSPLHRLLVPPTHYHRETLVGGTALVETSQVDGSFGRARYATNAAPLLINIRTVGEVIPKGSRVKLLAYDPEKKEYLVEQDVPVGTTVTSPE